MVRGKCLTCGKSFKAQRSSRKYCSNYCRTKANRIRAAKRNSFSDAIDTAAMIERLRQIVPITSRKLELVVQADCADPATVVKLCLTAIAEFEGRYHPKQEETKLEASHHL